MRTKLILIEGLPGSGKTTTARITQEILREKGVASKLYLEGNLDHPADYDGVAYFSEPEFQQLVDKFREDESILKEYTVKKPEGYFLFYAKAKRKYRDEFTPELRAEIFKNDIYELPLALNKELITKKWERFVEMAWSEEYTYIFDCCFVQNPITVSVIRSNSSAETAFTYINKLVHLVQDLNPLLIYLKQKDVEASLEKVLAERSPKWRESVISYYTGQGYGRAKGLKGKSGMIEVMKARKAMEVDIIERLDLESYQVDNSDYDIESLKAKIGRIIER
ncbi:MAG: hypothetical protein ACQEQG_08650 [Bacillota bacterium]